jgi:hypothetical protein
MFNDQSMWLASPSYNLSARLCLSPLCREVVELGILAMVSRVFSDCSLSQAWNMIWYTLMLFQQLPLAVPIRYGTFLPACSSGGSLHPSLLFEFWVWCNEGRFIDIFTSVSGAAECVFIAVCR